MVEEDDVAEPKPMTSLIQTIHEHDNEDMEVDHLDSNPVNIHLDSNPVDVINDEASQHSLHQPDVDDELSNDKSELDPITNFELSQVNLCNFLYGPDFIECKTYEEMIVAVRTHNNKPKKANLRNEQYAYNFSVEAGLSRLNGNKLLKVIWKF